MSFPRMRAVAAVAASAALTALLLPAPSAGAAKDVDFARGAGNMGIADIEFDGRNATAEAGSKASGEFVGDNAFIRFAGPITCLHVDGNRAGFIYPLDETSEPAAIQGQAIMITVEDKGMGVDTMGFTPLPPGADLESGCEPGAAPIRLMSGDFEVHDAS